MSSAQLIVSDFCDTKNEDNSKMVEVFHSQAQAIAIEEPKEDENTRKQCLSQLRDWILQNKDIENCIIDDSFLLRFLRVKKYSLYMTQQMILKYLNLRKSFYYMFYNLDYLEPSVHELITNGYIFASPFRDKHGRRVIIIIGRKFDIKLSSTDMAKAHIITYETLMDDEQNQTLGFTHVGDCAGISPHVLTKWNISEFITLVRWGQQSVPMKHKEIHIVNVSAAMLYIYELIASLDSQKLKDRTKVYRSFEKLHSNVDAHVLPKELGGKMLMNEMIHLWKKELAEKRDRLLSLDKMNLVSDQGIVRSKKKATSLDTESISGSFRKLVID